jgi:hypothetical protein
MVRGRVSTSALIESHNLYELLEVSTDASADVIHAAYRALARKSHPDQNPGLEAGRHIRQLNAAYAILSNPEQRARYDMECARQRRHARMVGPRTPTFAANDSVHARRMTRSAVPSKRPPTANLQRRGMSGQNILLLALLAVVALLLVLLMLVGLAVTADDLARIPGGQPFLNPA